VPWVVPAAQFRLRSTLDSFWRRNQAMPHGFTACTNTMPTPCGRSRSPHRDSASHMIGDPVNPSTPCTPAMTNSARSGLGGPSTATSIVSPSPSGPVAVIGVPVAAAPACSADSRKSSRHAAYDVGKGTRGIARSYDALAPAFTTSTSFPHG
jgi:hypothetical protein